jgi:hypothetical protein
MPDVMSTESQSGARTQNLASRLTLNSDGQRHPVLNAVATFTFLAGIAAFALGLVVRLHLVALILGIVVFGVGMVAQLLSATREQRVFLIAGIIAGGVGAGLAIAHGGFG